MNPILPITESKVIRSMIRKGLITLAGNQKEKIYGRLHCYYGKKLLKRNRVFFGSAKDIPSSFRPCYHCMREEYTNWKNEQGQ